MHTFQFPKWLDRAKFVLPVIGGGAGLYIAVVVLAGANPRATNPGYAPKQPIHYSHTLHAGELGIDCRYCHSTVENAATAAIQHPQPPGRADGGRHRAAGVAREPLYELPRYASS